MLGRYPSSVDAAAPTWHKCEVRNPIETCVEIVRLHDPELTYEEALSVAFSEGMLYFED